MNVLHQFHNSPHNGLLRLAIISVVCFCIVFSLTGVALALNSGALWANSSWKRVNAHGVCRYVRASDGKTRLVPTGTSAGWANFRSFAPGTQYDYCLYSRYRDGQCTAAGGTVVAAGGQRICRFNGSSCPGGWAQYGSWRTTSNKTCYGTNYSQCSYGGISCSTGSSGFGPGARETCLYRSETYTSQAYGCGKDNVHTCYNNTCGLTGQGICYANITQVGCY